MTEVKINQIAEEIFEYIIHNVFDYDYQKFNIGVCDNMYDIRFSAYMRYDKAEETTGFKKFIKGSINIICIENHNGHLIPFIKSEKIEQLVQGMINSYFPM